MAAMVRSVDRVNQQIRALLGQRIREERVNRDWSLELLAGISRVGRATLGQIELGKNVPQTDTLMRIAAAFEMKVEELLPEGYGEWLSPKVLLGGSRGTGKGRSSTPSSKSRGRKALAVVIIAGGLFGSKPVLPVQAHELQVSASRIMGDGRRRRAA